ncbi:MAG: hypothetical protein GY822_20740 [Deltaproteobacteria bacterium]|nr:hypothetical protein [Deltaproteobacteria bacterium]
MAGGTISGGWVGTGCCCVLAAGVFSSVSGIISLALKKVRETLLSLLSSPLKVAEKSNVAKFSKNNKCRSFWQETHAPSSESVIQLKCIARRQLIHAQSTPLRFDVLICFSQFGRLSCSNCIHCAILR